MFRWPWKRRPQWRLEGWDTFAGESYPIPGGYATEAKAVTAAKRWLARIERAQPSAQSGGQDGIQDRVYVVGPDGQRYRVLPWR